MFLHGTDLTLQAFHIFRLCIIGPQITYRFEAFLNAIRTVHFQSHLPVTQVLLHSPGAAHNEEGYGQYPQCRNRHLPVQEKDTDGDQGRGDTRAYQFRNEMRGCCLHGGTVRHDGAGQIGQILFPEEGQRYLTQLLSQGDSAHAALHISCQECGTILHQRCQRDQKKTEYAAHNVKHTSACHRPLQIISYQKIQHPYREHQYQIGTCHGYKCLYHILCTFFGKCIFMLQFCLQTAHSNTPPFLLSS